MREMTNATKAGIISVVNIALALIQSFGANLTDEQSALIVGLVNAVLALWIVLTYKDSAKRIPDPPSAP